MIKLEKIARKILDKTGKIWYSINIGKGCLKLHDETPQNSGKRKEYGDERKTNEHGICGRSTGR